MSTPSFDEISGQIHERSYATVPFSVTKAAFQSAIDDFVAFLALPLETKESAYFKIFPEDRGSEVGYKKYRREEGKTDNREYVHYHPLAEEHFADDRKRIPELDRLLIAMKRIYDEATHTLNGVIQAFDEKFLGIHDQYFTKGSTHRFYLRFLKYDRAQPGEFLAKGHYDRGGCALALSESAPGLRIGLDDQHVTEVMHREGEALFMPGLKFHELTSNDFPPAWHDVIQKSDDTYSDDIARWAIVLFADPAEMNQNITYEEAHTPQARV